MFDKGVLAPRVLKAGSYGGEGLLTVIIGDSGSRVTTLLVKPSPSPIIEGYDTRVLPSGPIVVIESLIFLLGS